MFFVVWIGNPRWGVSAGHSFNTRSYEKLETNFSQKLGN
jgi:hypothetical protein